MQIALIVVDLSILSLPISQYTAFTLYTKKHGGQILCSAAIMATRTGYLARQIFQAFHMTVNWVIFSQA